MTYDELIHNPDFEEISSVDYEEIKGFVYTEIRPNKGWAIVAKAYQVLGILGFLYSIAAGLVGLVVQHAAGSLVFTGAGVVFSFTLLIVLHELIHVIAYRWLGVRNSSLGMNLMKFQFYVSADRVVLDYRQSAKVALAPAVAIALVTLAGMLVSYGTDWFHFFLTVFSIHSLFCLGDFGLLCFFQNRPGMEIYNFDVNSDKKTCFYARKGGL